jgi:hypothetical protein
VCELFPGADSHVSRFEETSAALHVGVLGLPNTVQNNRFREISVVPLFSVKDGQYFGAKNFFLHLPAQLGAAAKGGRIQLRSGQRGNAPVQEPTVGLHC